MFYFQESQVTATNLTFNELIPGLAVGEPVPRGWQALGNQPLIILVGVTGVGKSTTLEQLAKAWLIYTLLPDRRELTDWLIIAQMQMLAGEPLAPVTDRKARFDYTRRYRQRYPGGMSHALSQLWVNPTQLAGQLLFDGLRGAEEVGHALKLLPQARFVVLDAPDVVRVQRLLGRNDAFDRVTAATGVSTGVSAHNAATFVSLGLPEAAQFFSPADEETLLRLVTQQVVTANDLRTKLQIVLEERRNYDPAGAIDLLQSQAANRTLVVDTVKHHPQGVAQQIASWLAAQ